MVSADAAVCALGAVARPGSEHPKQFKTSIKGGGAMPKQAGARAREPPTEEQRAEEERRRAEEERRRAEDEHRREVAEVQDAVRDLIRRLS